MYRQFVLLSVVISLAQAGQLAENIAKIIDTQFSESIDMTEEQVMFLESLLLYFFLLAFDLIHSSWVCRLAFCLAGL